MSKGYLIDLPLQTKLVVESSTIQRHIQHNNCGGICPDRGQRLLTMNSVAWHMVTD